MMINSKISNKYNKTQTTPTLISRSIYLTLNNTCNQTINKVTKILINNKK